jgi:hypothetical protein
VLRSELAKELAKEFSVISLQSLLSIADTWVGSFVLFVEESLRDHVLRTYSTYPSNCIAIVRHILGGVYGGSLSASERSPPPLNSAGRSIVVVLGNKTTFRHCLKGKAMGYLIRQRRFVL